MRFSIRTGALIPRHGQEKLNPYNYSWTFSDAFACITKYDLDWLANVFTGEAKQHTFTELEGARMDKKWAARVAYEQDRAKLLAHENGELR